MRDQTRVMADRQSVRHSRHIRRHPWMMVIITVRKWDTVRSGRASRDRETVNRRGRSRRYACPGIWIPRRVRLCVHILTVHLRRLILFPPHKGNLRPLHAINIGPSYVRNALILARTIRKTQQIMIVADLIRALIFVHFTGVEVSRNDVRRAIISSPPTSTELEAKSAWLNFPQLHTNAASVVNPIMLNFEDVKNEKQEKK